MRSKRFIVFGVMGALIMSGIIALMSPQASSTFQTTSRPTAYIEGTNVNASFKIGGRISEILVEEGEQVKKGQVIARLENKELQAKVAQAEAAVNLAIGKIEEATSAKSAANAQANKGNQAVEVTAETIDKQIEQAKAVVKTAEAQLAALSGTDSKEADQEQNKGIYETSKETFEKMQQLYDAGAVSQAQVDEANVNYQKTKAEYEAAKAQLEQAKAALSLAVANKGKVNLAKSDVDVAEAAISQASGAVMSAKGGKQQAEAALLEAKTYLEYSNLLAPADGIILTKAAEVGELVNTGYPVFSLETTDTRWAKFFFPEQDIVRLKSGDAVDVKLVATGKVLKGEIATISPAADFAVKKATQNMGNTDIRSFGVKVMLPDLAIDIPTGMTVQWIGKGE